MDAMDPYETARLLLAQSGALAIADAVQRVRSLDEEGDVIGVFVWELVVDALLDLSRTARVAGATCH